MEKQQKATNAMVIVAGLWLFLSFFAWFRPSDDHSVTERRELAQFPEITAQQLLNGRFMEDFESYTLDQFPMRDNFRSLKALVHRYVLLQKDNNGIYLKDGHIAQLEYPLNKKSVQHALSVFQKVYDKYLSQSNVYACVVPDKGYYLAGSSYPAMDYEALYSAMAEGMPYASFIDLRDTLSLDDYYRTDTHWRQEKLINAATKLCSAMDSQIPNIDDYTPTPADNPFYGVYYGQAALPVAPDTLYTMESDMLAGCKVMNYETGSYAAVYDESKKSSDDLYQIFLSGSVSLLKIENPNATTDKELIIFRDSFGSAISPLLVQGYKSVTLVDIRYISSAMLSRFMTFEGKDVLFLYSTLVLNNSSQLS